MKEKGLQEDVARRFFQQFITGLKYMHDRHYFHRDLKPDNLLLSTDGQTLQLGDFGLAVQHDPAKGKLSDFCGTPLYASPQIHTAGGLRPWCL